MPDKIIFLDVDGVLNCTTTRARSPSGFVGVMDSKVKLLKQIVDATGAAVVLSSDWRLEPESKDFKYLTQKLKYKGGITLYDMTPDISWARRGLEIISWLDDNNPTAFVILDDTPFSDFERRELSGHVILTDPFYGLTQQEVDWAIENLG